MASRHKIMCTIPPGAYEFILVPVYKLTLKCNNLIIIVKRKSHWPSIGNEPSVRSNQPIIHCTFASICNGVFPHFKTYLNHIHAAGPVRFP